MEILLRVQDWENYGKVEGENIKKGQGPSTEYSLESLVSFWFPLGKGSIR